MTLLTFQRVFCYITLIMLYSFVAFCYSEKEGKAHSLLLFLSFGAIFAAKQMPSSLYGDGRVDRVQ